MKLFLSLLITCAALLSFTGSCTPATTTLSAASYAGDSVYICYSATSYAYHSSPDCRGLNRCTHRLIKVSLEDARNKYNHRPCKLCE